MKGRVRRILALSLVGVAACSSEVEPAPVESAATAAVVATVDPGQALYDANCTGCHGVEGRGDGPMAASLPTPPANIREHFGDHSFEEMARRVTEGIPPTMPPAPIPPEEVRQVLSYVWSLIPKSEQARLRALQELAAEEH